MGSMPQSPEQQKQSMEMQEKQAQLQLKAEELKIRQARFQEGIKNSERTNARKDAEAKAKIVETASKIARRDK
jgi:molecular chaperone GrpE (heat shock protein)